MVELALPVRVPSLNACLRVREYRHVGRDDDSLNCLRDDPHRSEQGNVKGECQVIPSPEVADKSE